MAQADSDDTSADNVTQFPGAEPQHPRDATGAERQARWRQNQRNGTRKKISKNKSKASTVTHTVTPAVTPSIVPPDAPPTVTETLVCTYPASAIQPIVPPPPFEPPRHDGARARETTGQRGHAIDITAYVVAVALAGAAAFFSIKGMVVIFPGSPVAVVVMAVAMESAKLVTAGWLARRWRVTASIWRLVLVGLVAGLAIINATGVYAQLVAAHVGERGEAASRLEERTADLDARTDVQAHKVADLDRRLGQIDSMIEDATKRGRTKTAIEAMEGQRKVRGALADERNREAGTLAVLKAERASVVSKGRQIETEAAPIRYVAAVFGVTDPEVAIRWLIALMVLCCDPLAIALTAAASARRRIL
jgi:hypothetical protein